MTTARPGVLLRRHRDFRLLWCGETAGKFGASVTSVAMPLIAVSDLHSGTFAIGVLTAASWIPWLVIGLPVGVWVDRTRCRPIMLWAAGASLLLFAAVPVAARCHLLGFGLLLTVALLTGTAAVFFQTAYSAYLPALVAPADQAQGNAELQGSAAAAQVAGPGAGGLIAQGFGAVDAMFANAATFLVSLLCLTRIRHREPRPDRAARARGKLPAEVRQGLRLTFGDPWLRSLTLFAAASNVALMGYQSIRVVFLVRTVGLTPGVVGALVAVVSAGGVAGALVARPAARRLGSARATLVCEGGFAVPALLTPLADRGTGAVLFVAGGFCTTAGVVAGNVIKAGFQQRYCPAELYGRLAASTAFLSYGTIPVGSLLGGVLGATLGLRSAMWITAAGIPLSALVLVCSPLRTSRDLPARPRQAPLPRAPRRAAEAAGRPASRTPAGGSPAYGSGPAPEGTPDARTAPVD